MTSPARLRFSGDALCRKLRVEMPLRRRKSPDVAHDAMRSMPDLIPLWIAAPSVRFGYVKIREGTQRLAM